MIYNGLSILIPLDAIIIESKALALAPAAIIQAVLDTVDSPHTRRAYARALRDFITWYTETEQAQLNKAIVQRYTSVLAEHGLSPININQRLSAIRKLAQEAADNGVIPEQVAIGIDKVKGVRQQGHKVGNWLTLKEAQFLLNLPDRNKLKGLRDRTLLALLLGCGLRRQELSDLTFEHIQQREGRWVIVDLIGKGKRIRSVPMPSWAKAAIDDWAQAAGINEGKVFRQVNKGGRAVGEGMTAQAIRNMVVKYTEGDILPHDLRRSFAKLAHKGGSTVDQIQLSLGHASIQTTELYLGVDQSLTDAPCDRVGLKLEG